MTDTADDMLELLLANGWAVAGFSSCLSTMGVLVHNVLLQKGTDLRIVSVNISGGSEDGRYVVTLSPAPPKKKGWFG